MSWLKDRFQELSAQVNMRDGNRTASTVRAARKTQPAQTKKYTGNPDNQPGFQVTNNSLTRGLSRGYDQANTLDNNRTWKQRSPDTQVKSALQQAMANPVGGFNAARGAGLARSAIGTGQALSGLYDLATPGTGTNRLSKQLDQYGKNTDKFVKDNNLNTGVYKVQQGLGDVAQAFAGGAGLAKAGAQVATKVPVVAKGANILGNANRMVNSGVTQATTKLAGGNFGQRVTAGAVRNMANPKYQAANVGWNSVQMGKDASQGKDISPQRVALDTAIGGVGLPVAGAIAGQTGRSVANKVIPTLDRKMGGVNKAIPGTSLTFTNKNGVLVPQTTTKLAGQSIIRKVSDVKNQVLDTNRMLKENQGGFAKLGSNKEPLTVYHGGAGVDEINKNGLKILTPEEKMKYPSSGGGYVGLSTSADKNYAQQYSQNIAGHSNVAELKIKPTARIFEMPDGKAIDDMSANELQALSKKYDVIKSVEDNEYRVLNENAVTKPKRTLTPLKNNQAGFAKVGSDPQNVISSKSSTGDVVRVGDVVHKNPTFKGTGRSTLESEIYQKLSGTDGITPGKIVDTPNGKKIETPFYQNIIGVDTLPPADRWKAKSVLENNFNRINKSVSDLTSAGYEYNDPLQFGYKGGKVDLMDFSNAMKADSDQAFTSNMAALSRFYSDFGADSYANIIDQVASTRNAYKATKGVKTGFGDAGIYDKHPELLRQNYVEPNNVYISTNGREIMLPGVTQTTTKDGIKLVFSDKPLSEKDIYDWEMKPIHQQAPQKTGITPLKNNQGGFVKVGKGETPEIPKKGIFFAGKQDQSVFGKRDIHRSFAAAKAKADKVGGVVKQNGKVVYDAKKTSKPKLDLSVTRNGNKVGADPLIQEYADMLETLGQGNGVDINPETGARLSNNFRDPSLGSKALNKGDWYDEAARQIKSGTADKDFLDYYKEANNPELKSLLNNADNGQFGKQPLGETIPLTSQATPQGKLQPQIQSRSPQTQPEQSLASQGRTPQQIVQGRTQEQIVGKSSSPFEQSIPQNIRIAKPANGSKIPVRKEVVHGDTLTRTNVNPNVKAREQRFSVADDGQLLPDTNGATRVFTDSKGVVTNIRVGDEVYSIKDIGDLTNIKNYGSTVATQRRNIERAFKDNPTTGKRVNELVVDFQQEQATKMIVRQKTLQDGMKQLTDELGISFGVGRHNAKKVSAAIQDFGEKKRNYDSLVKEFGQQKADTIVKADNWFRSQYDQLLNEANKELTKYGYDPIPKRDNYYTHFSEPTLWQKFGLKMQEVNDAFGSPIQEATPNGGRGSIPNTLAGQSEYMVPNKKFNRFALRRKGDERTADAFQSFEKYINPTLNNIYMTPAITRARVMTKAIAMENDRVGKDANQVVVQMTEWANHLAGKSNRLGDRQAADTTGFRQALQASNWVQRKVGANSIVGNVATAVIQPIVLAQTAGKAGYKNTMLALLQEASTSHKANAAIRQSEFMKRRYTNLSPVSRGKVQRSADVASVPLRVIEETAGRVTWQANYNKALEQGLKGKQAIKFADVEAEKTMAGRAIGEKPELYRSKAAGFATQFQLEVNNYVQQVGKEMTPAQVAKTFTAAYGINLLIQQATGRSIGFNPIDAAVDSVEILAGDDDEKAKKVAQRWGGEIAGNAPVVSSVLDTLMSDDLTKKVFGNETPIGRFGVGSPYSSMVDNTVGKVVKGKPLEAAAYLAAPFGYSQVNKTTSGVGAVLKGEMTDKDGKTTVEVPQTAGNFIRGALFGPSAIKEVNQYYNNIGVKKEDQKPVQNQTDSKAAKMGAIGTKGTVDVKDQIAQAFGTPEGKKFLAMNEDEKKNHEYYTQYKAMQTGLKTEANKDDRPANYDTLSKGTKSVYDEQINLTKEGKEKWLKAKVNSKTAEAYRAINSMKPAGFPDLPNNNKVATILASYESKSGEWNNTQKNIEKNKALREAYGSELDDNDKWMLDASTAQTQQAIDNGDLSVEKLKQLVAYDNLSIQLGGSAKISKALRAKYGLGYAPSTSSGGSGRSGGSRKKASKYDYTKNLFDSGTSSSDVSKSLRSILEKAMAG